MTVRDIYIFQDVDQIGLDADRDDPETECLEDFRYARRVRRAPLIIDRPVRRSLRNRRPPALADLRDEEEAAVTASEDAVLTRAAFGGMGSLGAVLAVIGLLVLIAACAGPSWGWGADRFSSHRWSPYGFAHESRAGYGNVDDPDAPDAAQYVSSFDTDPRSLVDPPRAMVAGGALLLVGIMIMAVRRRGSWGL